MNRLIPALFAAALACQSAASAQSYEPDFISPRAGNAVAANKASQSEFMWPPESHLQQMDFSASEAISLLLKPGNSPTKDTTDGTAK